MKILIDIPEEEYRWIKQSDNTVAAALCSKECMMNAIKRGLVVSTSENPANSDILKNIFPAEDFHLERDEFISSRCTIIHKTFWDAPFILKGDSNEM